MWEPTARAVILSSTCVEVPAGHSVELSRPQNVPGMEAPMMNALSRALMTRAWTASIDGA